ncbi:5-bromo-4-chloroindolyl phosphate hydrolysis family protein [Dysosmobacter sp.]|uniref:5-bromo-4-chloroindolyl phosphate hydrolysis family protein n=1 Tax=Dysosmobacter sp. TaxID=2591382 RepID=UPI003A9010CD
MAGKQKKNGKEAGWGIWAAIVVLFAIGAWPIALILLLVKLFGKDSQESRQAAPPLSEQPAGSQSAGQSRSSGRAKTAVRSAMKSPLPKKSNAKWLKVIGIVLLVLGVAGMGDPIDALFWSDYWFSLWLPELLQYLALAAAGGAMLGAGVSMDRRLKRYAKYLAVMGDREAMPVEELARTLGYSEGRVEKDLEKMVDKGYFGNTAYLNVELGYLFRSGQADAELKRKQQEAQAAQTPKEAEEGYSGILRNIRRANDAIADPILSAKIDRLEQITARIFRAVEEDPKKAGRIDTFLNYYLPTTQKLLDSYAEFESAGVEGENLHQAKSRIEATMDAIVRGFEHQLDELYKADAMDVDSDIRVMETMLRRDTASVQEDFGLGGTARQQEEE